MKRVAGPSNRRPLLDGPVAGGLSLFVSPEAQFVLHPSHQPVGGLVWFEFTWLMISWDSFFWFFFVIILYIMIIKLYLSLHDFIDDFVVWKTWQNSAQAELGRKVSQQGALASLVSHVPRLCHFATNGKKAIKVFRIDKALFLCLQLKVAKSFVVWRYAQAWRVTPSAVWRPRARVAFFGVRGRRVLGRV